MTDQRTEKCWEVTVQKRPIAPPTKIPLDKDANLYYAGAKDEVFRIGGGDHNYPNAEMFVNQVLMDPCSVVFRTRRARAVNSKYIYLSLHSVDLDVEELDKNQKEGIREMLSGPREVNLGDIIQAFPPFCKCFDEAMDLRDAAKGRGKNVHVISTGFKGFRLLLDPTDETLHLAVERTKVKGSAGNVKSLVTPVLLSFFGVAQLPECIDFSIWGENKGVRSNLHPHAATGLWPRQFFDKNDTDRPYGGHDRDHVRHSSHFLPKRRAQERN